VNSKIPLIKIGDLETARAVDHSLYGAVITIEDSDAAFPFRLEETPTRQLVLKFDDVVHQFDDLIVPTELHIKSALDFIEHGDNRKPILIHCHAGLSRSPAIALAVLASWFGQTHEEAAVKMLLSIEPLSIPNSLIVALTDSLLQHNGNLVAAVKKLT